MKETQDFWAAVKLIGSLFLEKPETRGALAAMKLIHSSELHDLLQFKRYQDYNGIGYQEYRAECVQKLRRSIASQVHKTP